MATPGPHAGAAPGLLRPAEGPSGTRHGLDEARLTPERHGFGLRASTCIGTFSVITVGSTLGPVTHVEPRIQRASCKVTLDSRGG